MRLLGPSQLRLRRAAVLAASLSCLALAKQADANGFQSLEGHGGPIKGIALSPDGSRVLTASFDYSVGLWSLPEARVSAWLHDHDSAVNAVVFLPDGQRALSVGDDFKLILWNVLTGSAIKRFQGHRGKVTSVAAHPNGKLAATAGWDGWIGLWDLSGERPVRWLKGHSGNVNDVLFSADGSKLYSASYDGTIRRWGVETAALERTLVKHGFGVNRLVLNENSGWLAYGALDGAVRAIDLSSDAELADLTADRRPILALAVSNDGTFLAVGDGEGHIMVIDTRNWSITRDFRAATHGPVWALSWTSDDAQIISGGIEDSAALWPIEAADEEMVARLGNRQRSFLRDPSEMANGERQFARKCSICHTLTPDGRNRAGPTLFGLFGRRAGGLPGYNYSEALSGLDIVWGPETIDRLFDEGPEHYTPGSKMPMQRIAKAEDRRDLIEYLAENTGPPSGLSNGEQIE